MARTEREALILMRDEGGGFVSKLATAWLAADHANDARLRAAFPELLARYQAVPKHEPSPFHGDPQDSPQTNVPAVDPLRELPEFRAWLLALEPDDRSWVYRQAMSFVGLGQVAPFCRSVSELTFEPSGPGETFIVRQGDSRLGEVGVGYKDGSWVASLAGWPCHESAVSGPFSCRLEAAYSLLQPDEAAEALDRR